MEAGSEGEIDRNVNQSPTEGSKRPKRQMKTPFQLSVLEKTYSVETYPSEATRAELSEKLSLTDRQLQMWFCHRRLKDKKEAGGMGATKTPPSGSIGQRDLSESPKERMAAEPGSWHDSGSMSGSGSESSSSQFDNGDDRPMVATKYYEASRTNMERRVIACVEAQLGEPLREDGPILGIEFDELPPGAFGAPMVPAELHHRYRHSYDSKPHGQYDMKYVKASSSGPHEIIESQIRSDAYRHVAPSHIYDSPVDDGNTEKSLSIVHGNGHIPREYGVGGMVSNVDVISQSARQVQCASSPRNSGFITHNDDNMQIDRKRKCDETRTGREVQNEKKLRKELEKQDILRRKREEQLRKDMERQDRERRKEELRMIREQQRQEEKFQREERRELERREKFLEKERLRLARRKLKEEHRKEKEAARQKAAVERAAARRMAKESMELIEDERLELMELAASSKGLPSIVSLDYDTLQNLESFRENMCEFPPKSVRLRLPFATEPWFNSEENVGNLLMVWKFFVTFADVLGLWPFTLDEFFQAFHDYDSRLLAEIHIALLKLIVKDIEDVVRTPSGGPGTNQYSAVNPEGGHPRVIEGAYLWGFDIRNWQKHLNPLTWQEILRQFAFSAGFGPQLKKKITDCVSVNDVKESKSCEDIISTLRNGSAAENAIAIMQEKGFTLQRKSRHRLTPGTVKFAAYHVLALEGSKGLNVIDIAEKIQKSGLRDLTTSKTPEASISVALSRDPILFERIAPSTYCVRPAFRKDPADAESIITDAKEKIQKYAHGILSGHNVDEEERDDDSESDVAEGAEVDVVATPFDGNENVGLDQGFEIDGNRSGEPWVQGVTEGEYSDLSVEERLNALVALIGVANEGNSIRVILEDRMDAAAALKKQMWAEAQVDKRRTREEIICDPQATTLEKDASSVVAGDTHNSFDNQATIHFVSPLQQNGCTSERSFLQLKSYIGHKAEEMCVYRSLPLGQDRRRNRYWQFVASASSLDPGWGRIIFESPTGYWRLIDSEEAFDALLKSLDTRGTRESHLHIMLQNIEVYFKECVRKNQLFLNKMDQSRNEGGDVAFEVISAVASASIESPRNAFFSTRSDLLEPSTSFKIDLGKNESKEKNLLKRYEELQIWIWKECLNSSNLHAQRFGKIMRVPLLGTCDVCLDTFDANNDLCPHCHWMHCHVEDGGNFTELFDNENNLIDRTNMGITNSSSPIIRLIKAILTLLEACIPPEGLHSSWTEECRHFWGLKLQNASSLKDLLQLLTQFEGAIKRDYLSEEFETTEELLCFCASSRGTEFACPGSVPQLPWIPETTAAVALRLFELDSSVFYTPNQKVESHEEMKWEPLTKSGLRQAYSNDIKRTEMLEFDKYGLIKEDSLDNLHDTRSSFGYKNMRKRGGGRQRKKSQRGVTRPTSQSSKQSVKQGVTQILMQHGVRTNGQRHGRGPRTIRRRRTEKKAVTEILQDCLDNESTFKSKAEKPRNSGRVELVNFSIEDIVAENDDNSNGMEAGDSDDSDENLYENAKWGTSPYDATPTRSNEMMEISEEEADEVEDVNGYCEEDGENMELNDDDDSDRDGGVNRDEESDSAVSGDYSD